MSTNKPSIGSVIFEIAHLYDIEKKIILWMQQGCNWSFGKIEFSVNLEKNW